MNRNSIPQELMIQRCIDGELSDQDQVALVQELDADSSLQGWRLLAIGFLENQTFVQLFKLPVEGVLQPQPESDVSDFPRPQSKNVSPSSTWRYFSTIAACVIAGFILGYGGKLTFNDAMSSSVDTAGLIVSDLAGNTSSEDPSLAAEEDSTAATGEEALLVGYEGSPFMNFRVIPQSGQPGMQSLLLPVNPEGETGLPAPPAQWIVSPAEIQQYYGGQGVQLERGSRVYRVPLENGQEVIFPAQTFRVRHAVQ